jgi:hypothetical protein
MNSEIISDIIFETQRTPLNMTTVLEKVAPLIPSLLLDRDNWRSLYINYQPPHLMRIFCQVGPIRINLHYFLPTDIIITEKEDPNLYHPHAWASCMHILDGRYKQWMGFATRRGLDAIPEKTLYLVHHKNDTYAMNHPWIWHQVIPFLNETVSTLMITYIPSGWDQDEPQSTKPLRKLTDDELNFMFDHFTNLYLNISNKGNT